jgi:hypothetical protein
MRAASRSATRLAHLVEQVGPQRTLKPKPLLQCNILFADIHDDGD